MTGRVTKVCGDKGYGFIRSIDLPKDVFFHATSLSDDLEFDEQLTERWVEFDTIQDGADRLRARNVRAAD